SPCCTIATLRSTTSPGFWPLRKALARMVRPQPSDQLTWVPPSPPLVLRAGAAPLQHCRNSGLGSASGAPRRSRIQRSSCQPEVLLQRLSDCSTCCGSPYLATSASITDCSAGIAPSRKFCERHTTIAVSWPGAPGVATVTTSSTCIHSRLPKPQPCQLRW